MYNFNFTVITRKLLLIQYRDLVRYLIKTIYIPSEYELSICENCELHKITYKCNFLCDLTDDPNDPYKRSYHYSIGMNRANLYLSRYILYNYERKFSSNK